MRKTFARNVESVALEKLRRGEHVNPIIVAQAALGHAQVTSTQRYLESVHDDLAETFRAAATILGGTK